jgi:L-amino acid N-acyltransferase YncA
VEKDVTLEERSVRQLNQQGLEFVRIRRARIEDVPVLARLHLEVLPTAFLPLLGERFLRRLFRAQVEAGDAVAVVAERNGQVIGYSTGVVSTSAFRRRFLLRHGIPAALAVVPRLLRPRILRRLLETTTYPEKTKELPEAEWMLVGVRPGTAPGLGTELGKEVLAGLAALGVKEVKGFVACDNRAMNWMVRRMGFEQRGEISIHDGRPSNVYVIQCHSSSPSFSRSS